MYHNGIVWVKFYFSKAFMYERSQTFTRKNSEEDNGRCLRQQVKDNMIVQL